MSGRRYRIREVLGRGGQGTVYRAELEGEAGFLRPVALKVLSPDAQGNEGYARRLRDEARLLGMVRHRAIVHVDALVRLSGRWAIVLEWVDGVDLGTLLHSGGGLPPEVACEVVSEVAAALHAAAQAQGPNARPLGLCHRDLKPSNLLLTAAGEVKVLDFGIARATGVQRESQTRAAGVVGTPGYIAPEVMQGGEKVGPPADIFALGICFSELLTGRPAGQIWPDPLTWEARVEGLVASAAPLLREESGRGERLLRACLDRDPNKRPTAREVDRALHTIRLGLGGEPLRYWAELAVPDARPGPLAGDALCGRILQEGDEGFEVAWSLDEAGHSGNTLVPGEGATPMPTPVSTPMVAPAPEAEDWEDEDAEVVERKGDRPKTVLPTPTPRRAVAPIEAPRGPGQSPFDPGATFAGAREALMDNLLKQEDTAIRPIPRNLRAPPSLPTNPPPSLPPAPPAPPAAPALVAAPAMVATPSSPGHPIGPRVAEEAGPLSSDRLPPPPALEPIPVGLGLRRERAADPGETTAIFEHRPGLLDEKPPTPARRRWGFLLVIPASVLALGLAVVWALPNAPSPGSSVEVVAPTEVAPAPAEVPAPSSAPEVTPAPAPSPVEPAPRPEPPPSPAASPVQSPAPRPAPVADPEPAPSSATTPSPAPAGGPKGRFSVVVARDSAPISNIRLRSSLGTFPPGEVPVGEYQILGDSQPTGADTPFGRVRIVAGQTATYQCSTAFSACEAR